MRRFILLILCAAVALASCKTGQAVSDSDGAERATAAERLPMAVPDKTFALVRVSLGEVEEGTRHLTSLAEEVGAQTPEIPDPARSLVAALLRDPSRFESQFGRTVDLSDGHLSGLDTSATMYMALSTSGNDRLLRVLRNRVPETGVGTVPRGLFVRIFLPSTEPETLADWIEDACEQETYDCDVYERVVARDRGVVVDVRPGSIPQYFDSHGVDSTLPIPEDDGEFFAERTVAAAAFLDTDAALGVYLRSESLAELGAVQGMSEAFRVLTHVSPSKKSAAYQTGMEIAGGVFRAESPEAREVYDSVTLLGFDDSGVRLESVSSLTELGAEVARAGKKPVEMSAVAVEEPLLDIQYSYDLSAAREAAVTPQWMMPADEGDIRDVERLMRRSGIWLYLIAAHNYPAGFGRGLTTLAAAAGDEEALLTQQAEYLNGVRLSLTLVPDDASPLGVSPRGGLVAHFDGRADVEGWVAQLERELDDEGDQIPFEIDMRVVEQENGKEVRVLLGGVTSGEAIEVPSLMSAMLDLSRLRELVDDLEARPARQAKMAAPIIEKAGTLTVETRRVPSALNLRMEIGAMESDPLAMSNEVEPVELPAAQPDCLKEARRVSGRQMNALDEVKGQSRPEMMMAFAKEFELQQRGCEEAADEIAWIRAKWLKAAATKYANGLKFEEAVPVFEKACELGDQSACELAERARSAEMPVTFATVEVDLSAWVPRDAPMSAVGVEGIRPWRFQWQLGVTSSSEVSLESIDWNDERTRENVARMVGGGTATGFPVIVDRAAEAFALAVMSAEVGELLKKGFWRFRRSRTGPVGIIVPVEVAGRDELAELEFLPVRSQTPAVLVDVSTKGVEITVENRRGTSALVPIEGCSKDGPTICPSESLDEIWDDLSAAESAERASVVARYREAIRLSRVAEQFEKINFGVLRGARPARVRLVVGQDVPFAVLADIAAAAMEAGGDDIVLELAPRP